MNSAMFSEVMKELSALINESDLHVSQVRHTHGPPNRK